MNPNLVIKIGIVEDNHSLRKTLMALVNGAPGFSCVCASASAEDALLDIPRHQPDVVLMDIHLPGESGIACTARLTAQMQQLQVIMLTVYKDTKLIFQALKAGACGYVLKRSKPEEILDAVAEVRRGGAPMTSEIARMVVRSFKPEVEADKKTSPAGSLSARESEILSLLSEGMSNKEIGSRLSISAQTVRSHLMKIFTKLHVHCRTEAAAKYLRHKATLP